VSTEVEWPSETSTWNTSVAAAEPDGAPKLGVGLLALPSATTGPLTCVQRNVRPWPSGSRGPVASGPTSEPALTVWSRPGSASGAASAGWTWIGTVSTEVLVPSLAVSWKVRSVFASPSGATNVGLAEDASESVTAGPAVCAQV